jgi:hypothetical protein
VAQAPVAIPMTVGTSPMILGTLSRYTDDTLSVVLGTTQVSVAVVLIPVDPGSPRSRAVHLQVSMTSTRRWWEPTTSVTF